MSDFFVSFLLSFLSGVSTLLGLFIIFIRVKNTNRLIKYSLLFSSFIMAFVSLYDLIPSSYKYISSTYEFIPSIMLIMIYIIFGGLSIHFFSVNKKYDNNLYKIGIISLFALILHNIPEGIITFISSYKDIKIGLFLTISIALHNIPEGIILAISIYYSTKSRIKAFLYTFIAAISEPLGSIFAFLFIKRINDYLFGIILAITSGIMLYLAIFEVLKESICYNNYN